MTVKFSNNASGTLASSITTSSTTITLTTGQGSLFPSLASGEFFFATLVDSSNNLEIVKVTARATDVLTVVRAQDNTSARAFTGGDRFELRPVAAAMAALLQDAKDYSDSSAGSLINAHISDPTGAHAASAVSFTPAGGIAATDVQAAITELDSETPSNDGTGATGTWNIGISGNAATATQATRIQNTGGWNITPTGTTLFFNYNGTNVAKLDSSGNFTVIGNVTGYGTM
jgi:hypothetical protein